MMTLPRLAQSFEERLSNFQEERKVPLLSNMEIRGIGKNARESVIIVLRSRFEEIPDEIEDAINKIEDLSLLKQALERAATANSITEFEQFLAVE
jgi:glutathionyl-hydroquinone reductase